jgi:protoporphyrinogen oxidase
MRVGIIGGGITGLTAAYKLRQESIGVTVIEAAPDLGGLCRSFDFGPFLWDKFYHCILTSDDYLLDLIEELELTSELRWAETKTGFYSKHGLHSMSNSIEFLRFPPLSLWEKFRLGVGILRAARLRDERELEQTPVREWLIQYFGRGVYEKVWEPLLKCKLGACRNEASAAFIWSYITRYYSTREKSTSKKEVLGYVRGSYRTFFQRLLEKLQAFGTEFVMNSPVQRIERVPAGGVRVHAGGQILEFDRVIFTGPSHALAKVAPELGADYVQKLTRVKYLGVVCAVVILKRSLSPYYITNLIDSTLPLTGIIEMTAMVCKDEETAGRHLVYLPKYFPQNDPAFEESDESIWAQLKEGLLRVHPDLKESDIEKHLIFRERFVQPIPVLRYSEQIPPMQTTIPGLFVANSTFIINRNLNNNQMVKIAQQAVQEMLSSRQHSSHHSDSLTQSRMPLSAALP